MTRTRAILFDVNETLLDLTPVKDRVEAVLGGRPELASLWFTTMLQYSLVATVAEHYMDFGAIGAACLRMVARSHGIELGEDDSRLALGLMRSLPPFADVVPTFEQLRNAGHRLYALTNSSTAVVADQMNHAGLEPYLDALLSVEQIGLYKPHPRVYRWAAHQLGVDVSECLLVAAHGWDVAGASWAGMNTAFVARPRQQMFPLGPQIDMIISTLAELPDRLEQT